MNNKKKRFKKGEKVYWLIGRAQEYSSGKVARFLPAGTKIPNPPKGKKFVSVTYDPGFEVARDMFLIDAEDGTLRVIAPGYLTTLR